MSIKSLVKKRKIERRNLRNIQVDMDGLIRKNFFLQNSMQSTSALISEGNDRENELIVSLTTYSKRIHEVHLVIESIGFQTVLADRIILWLDEEEFTDETIPQVLKNQIKRGLEVRFCKNYRSYKKLFPTLTIAPAANVVTIDDDFLYPHDFLESLSRAANHHPNAIIGTRAHTMKVDGDQLLPYKQWDYESSFKANGHLTFLTTGAGTYFPSGILKGEICDPSLFMDLSPSADDVWINLMCMKAGIPRLKINDDRNFKQRFFELQQNQDIALNASNVHQANNDRQIKKIVEHFNLNVTEKSN